MKPYDQMVQESIIAGLEYLPQKQVDFFYRILKDSPHKTLDNVPGKELRSYYDLVYRSYVNINRT